MQCLRGKPEPCLEKGLEDNYFPIVRLWDNFIPQNPHKNPRFKPLEHRLQVDFSKTKAAEGGRGVPGPAKMSWQTYVDDHLMCEIEGHHLTSAAIVGHDGTVWAQSAAFPQFKPEEMTNIMKDFDEPGFLAPTGLFLGPSKYMVIQGEPGAVIRGKKGSGGITVKKTGQALVFGIYDEPMTPGQCNMVVERLGDYLVEQGL
ncbi:hypothetical protein GUJ93_ZPchr0012g20980 [Zizania palustris]|uniref:Profilin n=1 Tax=Zizania palustris TaxID=103762 RepID=A0A8J5WHY3_ZIZPA|nr:hypothetical protein GUJ93_ZPchr0012g20980 [Zizania palustris]